MDTAIVQNRNDIENIGGVMGPDDPKREQLSRLHEAQASLNKRKTQALVVAALTDRSPHVFTRSRAGSLTGVGATVSTRQLTAGEVCFDVAVPSLGEYHEVPMQIIRELIEVADKHNVALSTSMPGGQFEQTWIRQRLHVELGFQEDEDGSFLTRLPGGAQDPHAYGGFDLDVEAERAQQAEIEAEIEAEDREHAEIMEAIGGDPATFSDTMLANRISHFWKKYGRDAQPESEEGLNKILFGDPGAYNVPVNIPQPPSDVVDAARELLGA